MPKVIDVKLVGISADGTGGNAVNVSGRIFGVTLFQNGGQDENRDIFTFPDGPVTVTEGQVTEINALTSFTLTAGTEPPGLLGFSLQFGGELNVGSGFATVTTEDFGVVGQQQPHRVRIVKGDLEIRLDFLLNMPSDPF
jgi:hypothetical protein